VFLLAAGPSWADPESAGTPPSNSSSASSYASATDSSAPGRESAADKHALRYTLQGIEIRGNTRTQNRVVLRYVPFRPGDVLDVSDPEVQLTRFRLLGTGFFSSVQLSLRKGDHRGEVILVINVVERNTIIVNDIWLGLTGSRSEEFKGPGPVYAYGGLDLAETNLAGAGITLGGAMAVGDHQLAMRARFLYPAFLGTGWMTSASILYNDARDFFGSHGVLHTGEQSSDCDCAIVDYKRFGGTAAAGHDLSVSTQLWFEARVEKIRVPNAPLAASALRGLDREPISFNLIRGDSVLSTLRASIIHDTRDEPILPTRGYHISIQADTAVTPFGGDYQYTKLQFRGSKWWTLPWRHIVRLELAYGAVAGNPPFFEKFYVGDFTDLLPDRVLDLSFDRRTAPNLLHTDILEVRYGDCAAKIQGEYRVPLYRGHRAVYGIDLFGAVGLYGVANYRDLTDPPRGYTGLHKLPVDLTFNLGFRIDTAAGGFSFAFSNLLGLVPVRGQGGLWPADGGTRP
jgi:outer membrane protein insertion porin family